MDELLTIALWIMMILMTISAGVMWFNSQTGINDFHLGMTGYTNTTINPADYQDTNCTMTSWDKALDFAWCSSVGKIQEPVGKVVNQIWNLLTGWTNLINGIFSYNSTTHTYSVPAGDLFAGLLIPFLSIIEIGAVIVILMRLAAIIRGVAGGFL